RYFDVAASVQVTVLLLLLHHLSRPPVYTLSLHDALPISRICNHLVPLCARRPPRKSSASICQLPHKSSKIGRLRTRNSAICTRTHRSGSQSYVAPVPIPVQLLPKSWAFLSPL